MLNYFVSTTESLLLTALLAGLLYAYTDAAYGEERKKLLHIGSLAGLLAAAVMAVLKNTTSRIATGTWNVRIFTVSLAAAALFGLLSIHPVCQKLGKRAGVILSIVLAVEEFTLLFYALPDILANPFLFPLGGASVFSSAFFTRFAGWAFGLILAWLLFLGMERSAERLGRWGSGTALAAVLVVNSALQLSKILQILYTRRRISGHNLFVFIKWTSNHSKWFIYAALLLSLLVPALLIVRSVTAREPYENPAQHRKIRAKWRNARRWASLTVACFALGALTLTYLSALNSRVVELSPVEESELRGENVYVPLELVEDGHLHRFAYTTPDNITVRFIVIKKPNASSYGVGLDACDICGETGYYERNGQIVCKLCDVVMNVNTIGFKGGCNPIVIDYRVEGGYIIVPTYTLIDHQNEFK